VDIVKPEQKKIDESLKDIHDSYEIFRGRKDACVRSLDEISVVESLGVIRVTGESRLPKDQTEEGPSSVDNPPCSLQKFFRVKADSLSQSIDSLIPFPPPRFCGLYIVLEFIKNTNILFDSRSRSIQDMGYGADGAPIRYLAFNSEETTGTLSFHRGQTGPRVFDIFFSLSKRKPVAKIGTWGGTESARNIGAFHISVDISRYSQLAWVCGGIHTITDIATITVQGTEMRRRLRKKAGKYKSEEGLDSLPSVSNV
jgi:hypothetical protein